jgi:hypothetical protein
MSNPLQINSTSTPFNTSTRVYNGEAVEVKSYTYLTAQPTPIDPTTAIPARPSVLTDFGAVASDLASTKVVANDVLDNVPRSAIIGSFAAIRARRILHQYRIAFWEDSGIIDQKTSSTAADPTQADIDANWNNFQLFSYLPDELSISKQTFADYITPSKNSANVRDSLANMGINTNFTANPAPLVSNTAAIVSTLPSQTPFASNLSQFCAP